MQSLKSIRQAEVDNFFKQSFEQKKLIPLYRVWYHTIERPKYRRHDSIDVMTLGCLNFFGQGSTFIQKRLQRHAIDRCMKG